MPKTPCAACAFTTGQEHACDRPISWTLNRRITPRHILTPADPLPVYRGPGCTWVGSDPTHCTNPDSPLVLVPVPHSADGEAPVRMCRAFLAEASQATVPKPPRPTIVDQLAQRMDTGVHTVQKGWGTASHQEAARRTLAALSCLDDETVDSLALIVLFADHPSHPGEGDWDTVPPHVRSRWHLRIRTLLDALAKAAD